MERFIILYILSFVTKIIIFEIDKKLYTLYICKM